MEKILVYPFSVNPYQEMLYSHITSHKFKYLFNSEKESLGLLSKILFYSKVLVFRFKGYKLIHLHWCSFNIPLKGKVFLLISSINAILSLLFVKLIGYKIVWTVHNVLPHEKQYLSDVQIYKLASKLVNFKIVFSKAELKQMKDLGYSISNCKIIPSGNFINFYSHANSSLHSYKKLDLSRNNRYLLFFGIIRPYKGIENLIKAFTNVFSEKNQKLLIVGRCFDSTYRNKLSNQISKNDKIIFIPEYIEDLQVQDYFNIADMTILPFTENTNSGSAMLSISFGRPIIAPLLGNIVDFPKSTGIYYSESDINGLENSLLTYSKLKTKELRNMEINSLKFAQSFDWSKIGRDTEEVFDSLTKVNK